MLENNVCDEKCYNAQCNYDNHACDDQCYAWMLGNNSCQSQCNSPELNYDHWDCSCSPGCLPSMVRNSDCDIPCYTKACNYDNLDTCVDKLKACGVGCVNTYPYEYCNVECLTWHCNYYDNGNCNSKIITHAFYIQMIEKDLSLQANIYETCLKDASRDMLDEKTAYCTLSKLGDGACNPECNTEECAYDLGDCSQDCYTNCELCYEMQNDKKCLKCKAGKYLLFTACYDTCPYAYIKSVKNNIDVCILSPLFSRATKDTFRVIQVTNLPYASQDGSKLKPFSSLTNAFAHIRSELAMISLLNYDGSNHLLKPVDKDKYPAAAILSRDDRPLDFGGLVLLKRLVISTNICTEDVVKNCYDKKNAVLQWSGLRPIQLDSSFELVIENVDIYGYNPITIESCPFSEYFEFCTYCQNALFDYDRYAHLDDYGTEISWKYAKETDCQRYEGVTLFKISPKGKLDLSDLKIYNWRAGFSSIIANDKGIIRINLVKFENIILSSNEVSAVILSNSCIDNSYRCGEISITQSEVSLLNNGYEFNPSKSFSGFIYGKGLYVLEIANSSFIYNLAYKGYNTYLDYTTLGSLISLENFLIFKITDTTFSDNLTDDLIILKMKTPYEQEFDSVLSDYHPNLSHIIVRNVTFSNNSGRLMSTYVENELPNIILDRIYALENISNTAFLSFFLRSYRESWRSDRIKVAMITNVRTEYTLKKRTVDISNISFYSCYTSSYILSLQNIGNLNITSLHIEKSIQNQDISYAYMNTLVYSKFKAFPHSYVMNDYIYQDLLYSYGVGNSLYLKSITGIILTDIYLIDNYSHKSGVSIEIIEPLSMVDISCINVSKNVISGERAVIGLNIVDYYSDIIVKEILAVDNKNTNPYSYGVMHFTVNPVCQNCNLEVLNSLFRNNTAGYGAAFTAFVDVLYIENVQFIGNSVATGYGGSLYLNTRGQGSFSISILSCMFSNNEVSLGKGGAIAIDNYQNTGHSLDLYIYSSDFLSNTSSKDSSTLFISSSVKLANNSLIKECRFNRNTSSESGNVFLQYYSGVLTFQDCKFEDNESMNGIGIYYDIYQGDTDDFINMCKLVIRNCSFENNVAKSNYGSVLHKPDSETYSTLESFYCIFSNNNATLAYLEYGEWIDEGSVFHNNSAYQAGVLTMHKHSRAVIVSALVSDNISYNSAGAFELSGSSFLTLGSTIVINNESKSNGGVIFMEQKSIIAIQNCTITENDAEMKGSVLYSTGCNRPGSYISNSRIYRNQSKQGGSVYLWNSILNVTRTEFYENTDAMTSPGIILYLSVLDMNDTKIHHQLGHSGTGIYAMTDSDVKIYNSKFKALQSNSIGGLLYSFSSSVEIANSSIEDTSAISGGAIYASSESRLSLLNSLIYNSRAEQTGAIVKAQDSQVHVSNCSFIRFEKNAIDGIELTYLNIAHSKFRNGSGNLGGGISCTKCQSCKISNSTFEDISAIQGGAIFLTADKNALITETFEITTSTFIKNQALEGGAIFSENLNLRVKNCSFDQNLAYTPSTEPNQFGEGGAISMKCPEAENCNFSLESNSFVNNHADRNGGAFSWKHFIPIDKNNTYINNTAAYGNNQSSYPSTFRVIYNNTIISSASSRMQLKHIIVTLEGLAPGQINEVIQFELVDIYNNTVTTDSSSIGQLLSESTHIIISGITKVVAYHGVFTFEDFAISSKPGSKVEILFYTDAINQANFKTTDLEVLNTGRINVHLRECVLGEKRTEDKCIKCPNNTYSIEPTEHQCKDCPDNAKCYGEYYVVPKAGYWRAGMNSDKIFKCPRENACLGSPDYPNIELSGECLLGYKGNLCNGCQKNYSRSSKNTCSKCPDSDYNALKFILSLIGIIIALVWIVRTTMQSAYKPKSIRSICIKIFINYLQPLAIVAGYNLDWPSYTLKFLSAQENAGNISEQIISLDCLLYDQGYLLDTDELYYFKLGAMFALPFIMTAISFIIWGLIAVYYNKIAYIKNELIATIIILLFLIHPSVVNSMFNTFSCVEIEEGEYWLVNNMEIECWNEKHTFYALKVALPGIIVWGIAIPAICLILLIKYKRKLKEVSFRLKLGFLFNGYNSRYYYWELIIIYRKILIISISVFLGNISVSMQALAAISLLLCSVYLQLRHNPYELVDLNHLELRSIMAAVITIYCGLFYISGDLNKECQIVLFCIIVLINGYFMFLWGKKILGGSLKHLISKLPWINKRKYALKFEPEEKDLFLSKKYLSKMSLVHNQNALPGSKHLKDNPLGDSTLNIKSFPTMSDLYIFIVRKKNTDIETSFTTPRGPNIDIEV